MTAIFDFEGADQLTVGAIGEPGERVFLVQVRRSSALLTLKVEKQQVAALVEYFAQVVRQHPEPVEAGPESDLDAAYAPDFVVESLAVTYDEELGRIVIVAEEEGSDEDEEDGSSARISVTREQAAAFAIQGKRAVEAGRPPCPFCGHPLDARGHVCPRMNGHRPPLT